MHVPIHVLSAHPLATRFLVQVLSVIPQWRRMLHGETLTDFNSLLKFEERSVFVVDMCFLPMELTQLRRFLSIQCPGSKFLVLTPAERNTKEEMLRLLYAGVDGIVSLGSNLQQELPMSVQGILVGNLWVPQEVKAEYVEQTKLLLDNLRLPSLSLTARESQILPLLVRRLSNKEIAAILGIEERTVKFHVANIFSKLGIENRRNLSMAMKGLEISGSSMQRSVRREALSFVNRTSTI